MWRSQTPVRNAASQMRGQNPIWGTSRSARRRVRLGTPPTRQSTRGDAEACSRTARRCANPDVRRRPWRGLRSAAMDRCRFEGHRQTERRCLASGSQWHLSGQRGLLGIPKQARGIDFEVRGSCALRSSEGTRKLRSAFRLRCVIDRSFGGTSRRFGETAFA